MTIRTEPQLAVVHPATGVYRLGYGPDPWAWVPWQYGPFTGRWDDASGLFRVVYAADTKLACFLEALAGFRPDPRVLADFADIQPTADDAGLPAPVPGHVPAAWLGRRRLGQANPTGRYVDVGAVGSLAWLRPRFAARLVHYGLTDLDGSTIRSTVPRALTQEISSLLYGVNLPSGAPPDGIRFESRHGNDLLLWAVYERPAAGDHDRSRPLHDCEAAELAADDPDLQDALAVHGLVLT